MVVAINHFSTDTDEEIHFIKDKSRTTTRRCVVADHWADGGAGRRGARPRGGRRGRATHDRLPLRLPRHLHALAEGGHHRREIYGATDVLADKKLRDKFHELQDAGFGALPVCMAKTQYSLSTDPLLRGAPSGHVLNSATCGSPPARGFVVVVCGDIMTMPGLPKVPSAAQIDVNDDGQIVGLF